MNIMITSHGSRLRLPSRQAGFSLVELMVAVTVGLFLTLGLSQVFVGMYSTSNSQKSLAQYSDSIRAVAVELTNNVELAGYFANVAGQTAAQALPAHTNANDSSSYVAGTGIIGTGSGSGTGASSDTINVAYQTGGNNVDQVINCQGVTGPNSTYTTYYNSFYVNSSNQLVCTVATGATGTASTPLVLANNVKSMSILYGVANSTSTVATTGSWLTATQVGAAAAWGSVRAVQFTIVFNVPSTLTTSTTATSTWVQTVNLMMQT